MLFGIKVVDIWLDRWTDSYERGYNFNRDDGMIGELSVFCPLSVKEINIMPVKEINIQPVNS